MKNSYRHIRSVIDTGLTKEARKSTSKAKFSRNGTSVTKRSKKEPQTKAKNVYGRSITPTKARKSTKSVSKSRKKSHPKKWDSNVKTSLNMSSQVKRRKFSSKRVRINQSSTVIIDSNPVEDLEKILKMSKKKK